MIIRVSMLFGLFSLLLTPLYPSPVRAQLTQGQVTSDVRGIYVVDGISGSSIIGNLLTNPSVDGFLIRTAWSAVEPKEGNFSWAWLDHLIAQAAIHGKKVTLGIIAGSMAPSWVYSDGAAKFKFIWDQVGWGPRPCSVATIPVPWDPVFQAKWAALVNAFGAHYNSNPAVASIKLTGINSETAETKLPLSNQWTIRSGATSCKSYNDVANWQAAGYTRTRVEDAWTEIAADFHTAFPDKPLEAMLVTGFPPIDDFGNLIREQWQDTRVSSDLIGLGISALGAQFVAQNNGLSATWIWPTEGIYTSDIATGYQMTNTLGSGLGSAANLALGARTTYLELYAPDIFRQRAVVGSLHQALQ